MYYHDRRKHFKEGIKKIEEEMINKIFGYLKNGVFSNNSPNSYYNAYSTVVALADEGDDFSYNLLQYHNQTIDKYIIDCKNEFIKENHINLIDKFLEYIKKINFLIYWMSSIFVYLDRFYTTAKIHRRLAHGAMDLYK